MKLYLLQAIDGIEPIVLGPFKNEKERYNQAKEIYNPENEVFVMDIKNNIPEIYKPNYSFDN